MPEYRTEFVKPGTQQEHLDAQDPSTEGVIRLAWGDTWAHACFKSFPARVEKHWYRFDWSKMNQGGWGREGKGQRPN